MLQLKTGRYYSLEAKQRLKEKSSLVLRLLLRESNGSMGLVGSLFFAERPPSPSFTGRARDEE